jgi:hypothetical protein
MAKLYSQDRSAKDRWEEDRLLKVLKSTVVEYSKLLALPKVRMALFAKLNRLAS